MKKMSILILTLLILVSVPIAFAGQPAKADLDQVRNGKASSPVSPGEWENGNLNEQQAHYIEGYSVPYRIVFSNLPIGEEITLTIGYDIKHGGKNAIDYLTHYDYINNPLHDEVFGHNQEIIDPLKDVSGVSTTISTYPIPEPSSIGSPVINQPTNSFNDITPEKRMMTLFGGIISNVEFKDEGILTAHNDEAQIDITFIVDSETAVLAWGGHISSRIDWGYDGDDPRSAGGISGSPYHMRTVDWTLNNLGSQDRSLKVAEVYAGTIIIRKVVDLGGNSDYSNDWVFDFAPDWDEEFQLGGGDKKEYHLTPGEYTIAELVPNNWQVEITINRDGKQVSYMGDTANIKLASGEMVIVTFTNRPPGFVVPEIPLGTLGSIMILLGAVAFVATRARTRLI